MTLLPDDSRAQMAAAASEAAKLMRVLGHEVRLLILCELSDGALSVGDLQTRLKVSQSVLSQHLSVLRSQGLVATRRQAQSIFYSINDPACGRIITTLAEIFCPKDSTP